MAVTTLQCFLVHLNAFHRICLVYCGLLSCPEKGVLGFLLTLDSVEVHVVFVLQSLSCVQLFAIPQTAARQASLFFTISQSLLKLMSVELVMPSNHLILYCLLLLLRSIFPSIRVFFSELALRFRWPKYWSFSISPSNKYSGLIFFRIDWFDLLAVQGTLSSLLQHHSSKVSILQRSAFFMVQLSYPYVTTGKATALIILNFVGKVMSLLLIHCLGLS